MSIQIIQGDCRAVLPTLDAGSVQCVVTSPPYFGLRDYGTATWDGGDPACDHILHKARRDVSDERLAERAKKYGSGTGSGSVVAAIQFRDTCGKCGATSVDAQIGLEASPAEYIAEMVAVFREVWRVLRDDGCVFLTLGDSYASNGGSRTYARASPKPKDLLMIPARVAIALQADGWFLRSQMPWLKRSCMPESTIDRPTNAIEYIYLLTKSGDSQFWTHRDRPGTRRQPEPDCRWVHRKAGVEMSVMPADWDTHEHVRKIWQRVNLWSGRDYFYDGEAIRKTAAQLGRVWLDCGKSHKERQQHSEGSEFTGGASRNYRNSDPFFDSLTEPWGAITDAAGDMIALDVNTSPFPGAHFAVFPANLVEPLIKAGTSEKGCCQACGAPWVRTIAKGEPDAAHRAASGADSTGGYNGQSTKDHDTHGVQNASDVKRRILEGMRLKTYGWQPTCDCPLADPIPCTVLDPFSGAGTTALVADRLNRRAIGIELNPTYAALARDRVHDDAPLFADVS